MILLLDNFDSFTYNLVDYFAQLGITCHVERNDVSLKKLKRLPIRGIILSPGPEIPEKAGYMMNIIDHYFQKVPMLGVCLGHQAIGQYLGWNLIKAPEPRHGKVTRIRNTGDSIFLGIPNEFNVVQYNSLVLVPEGNAELKVIASTTTGQVMAIQHNNLPVFGVQFHPEAALTEHGLQILKNWVDYSKLNY